ncbi:MAG: type 1 glutamine amidotransferase domain-containing protein [Candidatus Sedimenticola sp. (ex Thyasira tokunagai)]
MRALIVSADLFEDRELEEPLIQLQAKDITVDIAAPEAATIKGKHGFKVKANLSVRNASPDDYNLLILPGGKAPAKLCDSPSVVGIAGEFMHSNKPIAAICHGPLILVATGLLAGRTVTGYSSIAEELKAAGAHYQDREVVVDGNLITSRQPRDLPAFMQAIYKALGLDG